MGACMLCVSGGLRWSSAVSGRQWLRTGGHHELWEPRRLRSAQPAWRLHPGVQVPGLHQQLHPPVRAGQPSYLTSAALLCRVALLSADSFLLFLHKALKHPLLCPLHQLHPWIQSHSSTQRIYFLYTGNATVLEVTS